MCPIRVDGRLNGVRIRKACRTTTWSEAEKLVADAVTRGYWIDIEEPETVKDGTTTLSDVIDAFCTFKQSEKAQRRIGPTSIHHLYSLLGYPKGPGEKQKPRTTNTLKRFGEENGLRYASQITTAHLLRWIDTWKCGRRQTALRIGRVREFFAYCLEREYTSKNPALEVKKPVLTIKDQPQRKPFKDSEVERIMDCAYALPRNGVGVEVSNQEIVAVILLMLHCGPGLADATALNESALSPMQEGDGMDWTYRRIKNQILIDTSIPPFVVRELYKLPRYEGGYFFYAGSRSTRSRTARWQQIINQVFRFAGMERKGSGGTHRFRHTYASRFLRSEKKSGGMYELSKLLGHSKVGTTEKYYAAYVPEIAARMRTAARSIW